MTKLLDTIHTPADVKALSVAQLEALSAEIREVLIHKINATGGHLGPNLGFIEPTVALHYVFNSPTDKLVFDVSHQCYTHKILTGRKEYFLDPAKYEDISGFTNPAESEHDTFCIGHTSTAPSLATGLAKARDLKGEKYNVIAILGDGSLSGGEALEGLDNAAELNSNYILLLNDNEMSIAPNAGGLYKNLALLRQTNGQAENNFFKAWGFDYVYVEKGNDIATLIKAFKQVKDSPRPVVLHLHTLKGKGCPFAEQNKERAHYIAPGLITQETPAAPAPSYISVTVDYLLQKQKTEPALCVISPGTPGAYGLTADVRAQLGKNYTDVGIAEEHGVAYASALAAGGAKPVLNILSSFVQRTYDQLSQDLALNNSPATLLVHWAGISGGDATHLGVFDIPLISNIPNIVYLAPTNAEEYTAMLDWSLRQTKHPVAIRVPFGPLRHSNRPVASDYSDLNTYEVVQKGQDVAVIAAGSFFGLGEQVCAELKRSLGVTATLINPRYLSGLDTALLEELKQNHRLVLTLEDGVKSGGFGEKIASYYGSSAMRVLNFGAEKEFTDRVPLDTLYERFHLTPELIVKDTAACLQTVQKKGVLCESIAH